MTPLSEVPVLIFVPTVFCSLFPNVSSLALCRTIKWKHGVGLLELCFRKTVRHRRDIGSIKGSSRFQSRELSPFFCKRFSTLYLFSMYESGDVPMKKKKMCCALQQPL